MKLLTLFIIAALCAASVFGQEPPEVEIIVPPIQAEAEDLLVEELRVTLPRVLTPPNYKLTLPLPDFSPTALDTTNFDLPLPETGGAASSASAFPKLPDSIFFSEGTIGLGSMNHMLGDLTLYKVGKEPRFSLHFFHSRKDGYQFAEQGSGFFNQTDGIDGQFSFVTERVSADLQGEYVSRTDGLQRLGPYESLTHSFIGGGGGLTLKSRGPFSMSFGMAAGSASAILAADVPLIAEEIVVNPSIRAALTFPRFIGGISADYAFYVRTGALGMSLHRISSSLELRFPVLPWFEAGGDVGVYWMTGAGLMVPFSLFIAVNPAPALEIKLSGGFKPTDESLKGLWKENPLMWTGDYIPASKSWYGDVNVDWYITPRLKVKTGFGYEYAISRAALSDAIDEALGVFVPVSVTAHRIGMPFSLEWNPLDFLSFSLGAHALFQGGFAHERAFIGTLGADISTKNGIFGGSLDASFPFSDRFEVPLLDAGIFLRPVQGLRFLLQAEDILSPAVQGGRMDPGVFKTPGFQLSFQANISL